METPHKFIISTIISTDEDPGLRIESFAIVNLRGVSFDIHHARFHTRNLLAVLVFYNRLVINKLMSRCVHMAWGGLLMTSVASCK